MDWEEAFFAQYNDACIGRLFRGIIHNLNGVTQTFSLQSALFNSMFLQADKLLKESYAGGSSGELALSKLQDLLDKRFSMVGQMQEKVTICEKIVRRTQPLRSLYDRDYEKYNSIKHIVDLEVEILTADSFFKHKVEKHISVADDLPIIKQHPIELHTIFYCLLSNAKDAMQDVHEPVMNLLVGADEEKVYITFQDNGCGINRDLREQIFDPFFSTSTERLGVGLYLTKHAVEVMNGSISFESETGETCFRVALPIKDI